MNSAIENFFINAGFSWTMSKALPYVLAIILGIILVWILKHILNKNKWVKWLFRVTVLILPFMLYFMYSPIYEGDFSNESNKLALGEYVQLKGKQFVVLTIPGCPYCYESIDKAIIIKERNPEIEIDYLVCGTVDEMAANWYKEKGGDAINVQLDSTKTLHDLARLNAPAATFPTFVLVKGDKLTVWSNNNFGVGALDEIESAY